MIKAEKTMQEVIVRRKFCDDCGKEIPRDLMCGVAQCEYCEKDLCNECIGHEDDTGGDYRVVWCKACWGIRSDFMSRVYALEKQIDDLYDECKKICKEKRNEK